MRWTEKLARRVFALPAVVEQPSRISVPGARALVLGPDEPIGPPEAFLIDRELVHLTRLPITACTHASARDGDRDGGGRLGRTPPDRLRGLIPLTAVTRYAPPDGAELDVIERLVRASHAFARPA